MLGYDKAQYCTLYYIDSIIHSIDYGITRLTVNQVLHVYTGKRHDLQCCTT